MKKKKALKVILVILLSLILVFILSLVAIFQFVIKPHSVEIVSTIEQVINDPEFIEEIEQVIPVENGLFDFSLENTTVDEVQQPIKPPEEYNNVYDYAKDNIEAKDLKIGMSFASRIDVKYILGLLKGGLTVPEKRELKAYLQKHFTSSEISQGIALYNKYSYLLK